MSHGYLYVRGKVPKIMDFWGELGKKISNAASNAADYTVKETEKLTNIAKAKYKLSNLKNKLDQLYRNVGELCYDKHTGESAEEVSFDELFSEIAETLEEIDKLELYIAKLRCDNVCEKCGSKLNRDMLFCPRCGHRQPSKADTGANDAAKEDKAEDKAEDKTEA